jgi:hypothetical protein
LTRPATPLHSTCWRSASGRVAFPARGLSPRLGAGRDLALCPRLRRPLRASDDNDDVPRGRSCPVVALLDPDAPRCRCKVSLLALQQRVAVSVGAVVERHTNLRRPYLVQVVTLGMEGTERGAGADELSEEALNPRRSPRRHHAGESTTNRGRKTSGAERAEPATAHVSRSSQMCVRASLRATPWCDRIGPSHPHAHRA